MFRAFNRPTSVPYILFFMYGFGLLALFAGINSPSILLSVAGCILLLLAVKNTADYFRAIADDKRIDK